MVKVEKTLWQPGDPVASIYGIPSNQTARVVFASRDKLVLPPENPKLLLMKVDKQKGDNPLQIKTVWFVSQRLMIGLGIAGALAFLLRYLLGLRSRRKTRNTGRRRAATENAA